MDNALLLYLKKLEAKIDGLDIDIAELNTLSSTIKVTVDDILNGTQLAEWIADLEAAGKSSTTYNDANRMNKLITNDVACRNTNINQHLFDWSASNNKVGTFYNTGIGAVSGVNWSSLSSISSVTNNTNAFRAVANDSVLFEVLFNNTTAKETLWTNSSVTESVLQNSTTALNVLNKHKTMLTWMPSFNTVSESGAWFLLSIDNEVYWNPIDITLKNGGALENFGKDEATSSVNRINVNRFVTSVYARIDGAAMYRPYVIDFG